MKDLFSYQTVDTIRSSNPSSALPAYPLTQTLALLCCNSDTTSGGTLELQQNCSPHLKHSHLGQCGESAQDSHTERAVCMGLQMTLQTPSKMIHYCVSKDWNLFLQDPCGSIRWLVPLRHTNLYSVYMLFSVYVYSPPSKWSSEIQSARLACRSSWAIDDICKAAPLQPMKPLNTLRFFVEENLILTWQLSIEFQIVHVNMICVFKMFPATTCSEP